MAKSNGANGRCDCGRCQAHDHGLRGPWSPADFMRHFTVTSSGGEADGDTPEDTAEAALALQHAIEARERAKADYVEASRKHNEAKAGRSKRSLRKASEAEDAAWALWEQASADELAARQHHRRLRERDFAQRQQAEQDRKERERREHEETQAEATTKQLVERVRDGG